MTPQRFTVKAIRGRIVLTITDSDDGEATPFILDRDTARKLGQTLKVAAAQPDGQGYEHTVTGKW